MAALKSNTSHIQMMTMV